MHEPGAGDGSRTAPLALVSLGRAVTTYVNAAHRFAGCSIPIRRFLAWSGRWVSNPRPRAWKALALPTELLPLAIYINTPGRRLPQVPRGRWGIERLLKAPYLMPHQAQIFIFAKRLRQATQAGSVLSFAESSLSGRLFCRIRAMRSQVF